MIIIPFSAFRSLAMESEDGTFELLSISALSAWQIIFGKDDLSGRTNRTVPFRPRTLYRADLLDAWCFSVLDPICSRYRSRLLVAETAIALLLAAIARSRLLQGAVTISIPVAD